jgi:hypothetical protein
MSVLGIVTLSAAPAVFGDVPLVPEPLTPSAEPDVPFRGAPFAPSAGPEVPFAVGGVTTLGASDAFEGAATWNAVKAV